MHRKSGFTLIELSIVLVVLGLLVGGVLAGQSLVHASKLRGILRERDEYATALEAFQQKYDSLPGDLPTATGFWSAAPPNGGYGCLRGTRTAPDQTCNGNGDGYIDGNNYEDKLAWEHLGLAGLISIKTVGWDPGGEPQWMHCGVTTPKAKFGDGTCFNVYYIGTSGGDNVLHATWRGDFGHILTFDAYSGPSHLTWGNIMVLTPSDAYNIDMKSDDGKPGIGKTRTKVYGSGYSMYGEHCADGVTYTGTGTSDDPNLATYNLDVNVKMCAFTFVLGY